MPPPPKPTVVVIGGGFSGLGCCRHLCGRCRVVLIDAKEYFEYTPGICRAYVDPEEQRKLAFHYVGACHKMGVEFVWGEVKRVDPAVKLVEVKEVACKQRTQYRFDYLLCANGSQYGLYMAHRKMPSNPEECLWYPTFLEKAILNEREGSEWAALDERFMAGRRAHFKSELRTLGRISERRGICVVVGAGFVGVEWATELKHVFPEIRVVIVEKRDRCLATMPTGCVDYCQRYLDRAGIETMYGVKYTFLTGGFSSSQRGSGGAAAGRDVLAERGLVQIDRMYMAVGVRSIAEFMPDEVLTEKEVDEQRGSFAHGGWIRANRHMQVVDRRGEPWLGGCAFACGNACQVQGDGDLGALPKNSAPGEDMAAVACRNVLLLLANGAAARGAPAAAAAPPPLHSLRRTFTAGICATSLGPRDATLVLFNTAPGTGYTCMTGCLAAVVKELVRYTKVDECKYNWFGRLAWCAFH